jgi:hypothetical protein
MSDSSERRALRKLQAEGYRYLPSREVLQAATVLEQAKAQRAVQEAQLAVQRGSLAVAVLSQVPRDIEENKRVFATARDAAYIAHLRSGDYRECRGHLLAEPERRFLLQRAARQLSLDR